MPTSEPETSNVAPSRVLVIAGSDSGGGAGIQADIKTITALGGYAATAITALTAQNTLGVHEVLSVDPFFVEKQIDVVLEDIGADAIKVGMLDSRTTVELVARRLEGRARGVPLVVDPVIRSSSGYELASAECVAALEKRLFPLASLITPNTVEAQRWTGVEVIDRDTMSRAADGLLLRGAQAVLITGGHLPGETVIDLMRTVDGMEQWFEGPRIESKGTHGTGCTLSSAIAVGLAEGLTLAGAIERARRFVVEALRWATPLGKGTGPVNHVWQHQRPEPEPE